MAANREYLDGVISDIHKDSRGYQMTLRLPNGEEVWGSMPRTMWHHFYIGARVVLTAQVVRPRTVCAQCGEYYPCSVASTNSVTGVERARHFVRPASTGGHFVNPRRVL